MNLDDAQKNKVSGWIAEGLKLSEIQRRMDTELGIHITYMEARLLMDDLKLVPKDAPSAEPEHQIGQPQPPSAGKNPAASVPPSASAAVPAAGLGKVSVKVDAVTQPGTLVSGTVTFSDGISAGWHLDQMGRLGMAPKQPGYRPSPEDIEEFQLELQTELAKLGF
jgi:hypothetical protein